MRDENMEWEQIVKGYTVKFNYSEHSGYKFKIYLDDKEVYDFGGLQDTDDRDWIVRATERVIRDELPILT